MGILISQLYENIDVFNIYGDYASALLIYRWRALQLLVIRNEPSHITIFCKKDAENVSPSVTVSRNDLRHKTHWGKAL